MLEHIRQVVLSHQPQSLDLQGLIPAAVLVPFLVKDGEPHLLLHVRTEEVETHKGQVGFPGGVCEQEDADARETALREAWEEVGLRPEDVTTWGVLNDIDTVTGFRITPVVGLVPEPYDYKTNPAEVAKLLRVPWRLFSERQGLRREVVEHEGRRFEVDFYPFEDTVIWGATARILRDLVELLEGCGKSLEEA